MTLTGAGSCTITAGQPGGANWNAAADVSQMFTINKMPQSVTFSPLRTRAVSNPPFTVSATATSGLPVSFSATGSCSVSGTTVALSGVGNCTITTSQPGDANWGAAANVPQTFAIVTSFKSFIPVLLVPGYPDLVARFSLSTSAIAEHTPVIVTVTITNQGYAPADPFWVDFYVNPSVPPTVANQPWDKSCGRQRCEQGIAWYVDKRLAPGESITLTSTPDSYYAKNTVWDGSFNTGLLNLYLYADSWNPGVPTGAVYERDEVNNRAEFHTPLALASAVARTAAPLTDLPALPPRPARPDPR